MPRTPRREPRRPQWHDEDVEGDGSGYQDRPDEVEDWDEYAARQQREARRRQREQPASPPPRQPRQPVQPASDQWTPRGHGGDGGGRGDGYGGGPGGRPSGGSRPRHGFRRAMALLLALVLVYVVVMGVVIFRIWASIEKVDAAPDVADRPAGADGTSYLLVGTDSRDELTEDERSDFGTGQAEGHRADTMMLLHLPSSGDPVLVSLPRDSFVSIRDQGENKLNAAHAVGGPELLVDTVEQNTGMAIDGYLEIGFGGFVRVVEKVGGVEMCLDQAVQDDKAHIDLPAGCQDLAGPEALGYVRMRYNDPRGDLGRVERQREFLSALVDKMASPATVLNPFRLNSVGTATGEALAIGEDTSMLELGRMALGMRAIAAGDGISTTVPIADPGYASPVGSVVLWDAEGADAFFSALRNGDPVSVEPQG